MRAAHSGRFHAPVALHRAPASALDPLWKCCSLLALRSQMDPQTPTDFALLTLQWPEVASSPCALQAGRHPPACMPTCGARWCCLASWTPTHTLACLAQASLSASFKAHAASVADKGHTCERSRNPNGSLSGADASTAADAAHWSSVDVERRMDFALRCAYAHGTQAVRTHLMSGSRAQFELAWCVSLRSLGVQR